MGNALVYLKVKVEPKRNVYMFWESVPGLNQRGKRENAAGNWFWKAKTLFKKLPNWREKKSTYNQIAHV